MHHHISFLLALSLCLVHLVLGEATQLQTKQTSTGVLSSLKSLVLAASPNVLPIVFMFSLGALMVPTLGLSSFLHAAKQRSIPTFGFDTTGLMQSVQEVFDKFTQAIERMDQKLNN